MTTSSAGNSASKLYNIFVSVDAETFLDTIDPSVSKRAREGSPHSTSCDDSSRTATRHDQVTWAVNRTGISDASSLQTVREESFAVADTVIWTIDHTDPQFHDLHATLDDVLVMRDTVSRRSSSVYPIENTSEDSTCNSNHEDNYIDSTVPPSNFSVSDYSDLCRTELPNDWLWPEQDIFWREAHPGSSKCLDGHDIVQLVRAGALIDDEKGLKYAVGSGERVYVLLKLKGEELENFKKAKMDSAGISTGRVQASRFKEDLADSLSTFTSEKTTKSRNHCVETSRRRDSFVIKLCNDSRRVRMIIVRRVRSWVLPNRTSQEQSENITRKSPVGML